MEVKLTIVVLVVLTLVGNELVAAVFFYNPPPPPVNHIHDNLSGTSLKCVPGRTTIKVTEKKVVMMQPIESESDEYGMRTGPTRRKHMTVPTDDESCQICVCSASGKDEYCSKRPANNINECIYMKDITDRFHSGAPYEHERSLAFRMRRGQLGAGGHKTDYLWHNDEIPYDAKSKCFRGHSYYTNSLNAENTDIDIGSEVESLLDYSNEFACFYCVCSVDGGAVGCINRDVSFCNFFRVMRSEKSIRDRYTSLLQQDRPSYFRTLSYRMRRTMDNGIFDLLQTGGDTLCCHHPDGHRRLIHTEVRNKLRTLKKRIPKENLLGHAMREDYVDFVVNND